MRSCRARVLITLALGLVPAVALAHSSGDRRASTVPAVSTSTETRPSAAVSPSSPPAPAIVSPATSAVDTASPSRPPTANARPATRSVDEIIAAVRNATARYLDIARARADGFIQASAMEPRHGYHFIRPDAQLLSAASAFASGELDLARPPMLLYVEREGHWQLVGVEYALPSAPSENPFPGAEWHQHEASCHYRDYRETPAVRAADCPAQHPDTGAEYVFWHPAVAVAHVWAWYPNPDGPFAVENRYLAPYGGVVLSQPGHRHARNPAELLYSQWTHRAAGAILLGLAGVITWQIRRARPFPWNALSAPLWIVFGLYLFATSDPESWPLGPKRFGEIFGDTLVLQHKLLALLPIAIGVIEALTAAGILAARRARYIVPTLAVLGGTSLLLHFHEGEFHLDAIYLQHAAMGLTAVGLGAALLLARRNPERRALLVWVWPAFLVALSLVLLFYSES